MQNPFSKIDVFTKNIIIVFAGTSLFNFFNLIYQLLCAHRLSVSDFAAFGSLLSLFMVLTSPLLTLQIVITKYCAEFNTQGKIGKVRFLLSDLFKKTSVLAIFVFLIFYFLSSHIMDMLKIRASSSGYILAALLASYCLLVFTLAGAQGIEFFWWLSGAYVMGGALKVVLTFIFLLLGLNINGALAALLISNLLMIIFLYFPLRHFIFPKETKEKVGYREFLLYLFPVAVSYLCFTILVSFDMVLVKYFFTPYDSGLYSLAQLLGKIFLFLPVAISTVMFPKTSGLKAKSQESRAILTRSVLYAAALCIIASAVYNLFPVFVLKMICGKSFPELIRLGRLFSLSMSLFALVYILILYLLSKKDLRFMKYLGLSTFLQLSAIVLFHESLVVIQSILCINSILLFAIHLGLAYPRDKRIKSLNEEYILHK